jgi:hypothetical protein
MLVVAGFTGAAVADGYVTEDPGTTIRARDVTVIRTPGSKWIDGDVCVALELQVGRGILARHRFWFRCDHDTRTWVAQVTDGPAVVVTLGYEGDECLFTVDRSDVDLVPVVAGATCGLS